ncbi:MAG TPA: methyltransferase domain-containing protein [bacterium]|nr:methyltransferase domain-containing protein [bacterium]
MPPVQVRPACSVCGGPLESFRPGLDPRSYFSCRHCGFIQLEKAHHLTPEKQKERYLQHQNSRENRGYVEMFEGFIAQGIAPFVRPGGRLLDFGCGPEPVLAGMLRERGYAVDSYDLFFQKDEAYLDKQYDLILLTEVLEHLADPKGTLQALSERLAPGGFFSLMTLFHPEDRGKFSDWWYRRDPTHVSFFTAKTLGELGRGLGMTVLFSDPKNILVLGKRP